MAKVGDYHTDEYGNVWYATEQGWVQVQSAQQPTGPYAAHSQQPTGSMPSIPTGSLSKLSKLFRTGPDINASTAPNLTANLAANLKFGTTTNAMPGAVGSFKGPAAFKAGASAPAGGTGATGGAGMSLGAMAIPAAMLAFALASNKSDARKEQEIIRRYQETVNAGTPEERLGDNYGFLQGQGRSYFVNRQPGNARGLAGLGYSVGSPGRQLQDALTKALGAGRMGETAGGARAGMPGMGLVEYRAPTDNAALRGHLTNTTIPMLNWAKSAPRFHLNDAGQDAARAWVAKNPAPVSVPVDTFIHKKSGDAITRPLGSGMPSGYERPPAPPATRAPSMTSALAAALRPPQLRRGSTTGQQ